MENKVIMNKKLFLTFILILFPTIAFSKDLAKPPIAKHEKWSYRTLLKKTGKNTELLLFHDVSG
jgi:hypothetical protein